MSMNAFYQLIILSVLLSSSSITGMSSWPEGLYGLPMAINGCPVDPSINWKTGTLYQDCEDTDPRTQHSPDLHLNAFIKYGDVQRSFCMKTSSVNDSNRDQWPSGKYCIYLWGKTCPSGMLEGWVQWDDENTIIIYNKNTRRGTLPTGVYDQDTRISYCCSVFGSTQTPIDLPLTSPFYLIAYGSKVCQLVRGAQSSLEYIFYETEYSTFMTKNDYGGAHPYGVTRDPQGQMIFYCYYRPIHCPALRKPDNGMLKPAHCGENNQTTFNGTCTVTCNSGFIPKNPAGQITSCLENGTWSIPIVTGCIPVSMIAASSSMMIRTSTIQPTTVSKTYPSTLCFTTYSTTKSSGIVSTQSLVVQTSSTAVSAVTEPSKTTSSAGTQSPTVNGGISTAPPREEETMSFHQVFPGTSFLVGTVIGALAVLGLIIASVFWCRRRTQYEKSGRGKNVTVYMSDLEKSFSVEDLDTDRPVTDDASAQENFLYERLFTQPRDCEEKSSENLLYESFHHRVSVTKVEDNVLYESLSFAEGREEEKNKESESHLHYKTIT